MIAFAQNFLPRDYPCLIVGILMLAYWGRVARMAYKMRRKTGRAANFIPTEPLGKTLRIIWQPIVWAWIVLPIIAAFRPAADSPIIQWLGVVLAVAAFLATLSCWRRMGKSWRMGIDPTEKTTLIFTGPYAYVRHPIYGLSSLLMIATVMVLPTPLMMFVAIVHLMLLQWEARREERNLSRLHGQQYDDYRSRTGRFFPASVRAYSANEALMNHSSAATKEF